MTQYVDGSCNPDNDTSPRLVLTPAELFYALKFLDEQTVRAIFAHVNPGVLAAILKACQAKDKDAFCHIVKANEVRPSDQLLDYLIAGIRELSLSGIMSLFPSEPSERIKLLDAMNSNPVGDVLNNPRRIGKASLCRCNTSGDSPHAARNAEGAAPDGHKTCCCHFNHLNHYNDYEEYFTQRPHGLDAPFRPSLSSARRLLPRKRRDKERCHPLTDREGIRQGTHLS